MSNIKDTEGLIAARAKMKAGEFSHALSLMINDLNYFPDNLPLRANIASCYYMTGNYLQYKKHTFELLQCYEREQNNFEARELRSVKLALVRLLEELGEISICFKLLDDYPYKDVVDYDKIDIALIAQLLRLQTSYSVESKNTFELYNHCRRINSADHSCYVDLECALLFADWSYFGAVIATDRLKNFIINDKFLDHQKRQIVFDHLYEFMRTVQPGCFDINLLSKFTYLEADPFERFLWDFALIKQNQKPNLELNISRSDQMSIQGAFKALYLLLIYATDEDLKKEISKKISFLLSGISQNSRAILLKTFPIVEGSTTVELAPDHLSINGRILPRQKCKTVHRLFSALTIEDLYATDSVIKSISGESFDTNSYAKMRVLVSRANNYLFKNFGVVQALSITKESIEINRHLQVVQKRPT